ncbi:MAG: hypothetical protein ACFB0G_08800 [Leptolyngbyaceae cyanobacterium]
MSEGALDKTYTQYALRLIQGEAGQHERSLIAKMFIRFGDRIDLVDPQYREQLKQILKGQ